jgi:hypothetical protein
MRAPALVTATDRRGRIIDAAAAATTAATTAATASATRSATATRARAAATTTSATGLATATTASTAASLATALTSAATLPAASGARGSRPRRYGIRGRAKAVISGSAKRIKNSHNNEGDSDDQEGVFGCILPGLLSPEPFEDGQHGNTFSEGTLTPA